ncbi:hypothetical protein E8E13_003917 [Curvularia kusanoi]|uniref:Uncharacterized protein n=1 Tax=Curvularia kusanoi TaxID=90978 RepID=A0A9P4WBP1_CURKU|nr:hypothetical protein E8E13_003917 [Curvularia kusanoi]
MADNPREKQLKAIKKKGKNRSYSWPIAAMRRQFVAPGEEKGLLPLKNEDGTYKDFKAEVACLIFERKKEMEREEALKRARHEEGIFENFEEEVAYLIAKRKKELEKEEVARLASGILKV